MRILFALVLPVLMLAVGAPRSIDAACRLLSPGETGCVPPDKPTLKCELRVNRNVAKLHAAIVRCHRKEADLFVRCHGRPARGVCKTTPGKCTDGICNDGVTACASSTTCPPALFNDESCETTTAFDAANSHLTGCPACLDAHTVGVDAVTVHDRETRGTPALEVLTYCAGNGTTLGDGGLLPPDVATLRCEDAFGRNIARFLAGILACHGRAATAGVKGATFDASGCEAAVAGRFDAANAGLKGCGACTTESAAVVRMIRTQIDDDHAIFCAE